MTDVTFNQERSSLRVELKLSEQRIISLLQLHEERIQKEIEDGVVAAFNSFSFSDLIMGETRKIIQSVITDQLWKGELKKLVEQKIKDIVDPLIEKDIAHLRSDK